MVVCDGQCACTLCDWLNVTLNSHIAVACSKQWHSSQSSRSLNKCWNKHASGERVCLVTAQVNVSSLYFVALVSTHCVIAPNIVLSAIGLPESCVYMHDSSFVANGVSRQHNCATGHSMLVCTGAKSPGQLDFDLTIFCSAGFAHTKTPFIYARKHVNSALFAPVSCCTNWLWVK